MDFLDIEKFLDLGTIDNKIKKAFFRYTNSNAQITSVAPYSKRHKNCIEIEKKWSFFESLL